MKRITAVIALILLVSCNQSKIGYVDHVELMDQLEDKKSIESKYQARSLALNKKRDSISQAFQLEAQAFQAKAQTMSQEKAQEEYDLLQQRGQFMAQQLQQEEQQLQLAGQAEMDSLINEVKSEIRAYGKAQGYSFILSAGEGGSVLYGEEGQDVTEAIIKILAEK